MDRVESAAQAWPRKSVRRCKPTKSRSSQPQHLLNAPSIMASSLASHLASLTPQALKVATEHPFLLEAGKGTLSAERLAAWLTQDRLYGLIGYTKLLGGLLQRCPSFDVPPGHPKSDLYWKRLRVLGGAMSVSCGERASA